MNYLFGIFLILHGLVHLLYMGHSFNYFELEKGFVWSKDKGIFSNIFSLKKKQAIAGSMCIIAAFLFIVAGIFLMIDYSLWKIEIFSSVFVSTLVYVLFWDGTFHKLHTQGGIAIFINIIILIYYI